MVLNGLGMCIYCACISSARTFSDKCKRVLDVIEMIRLPYLWALGTILSSFLVAVYGLTRFLGTRTTWFTLCQRETVFHMGSDRYRREMVYVPLWMIFEGQKSPLSFHPCWATSWWYLHLAYIDEAPKDTGPGLASRKLCQHCHALQSYCNKYHIEWSLIDRPVRSWWKLGMRDSIHRMDISKYAKPLPLAPFDKLKWIDIIV